jgi:hypothetical protein
MQKEYKNNERVLDANGNYIDNPNSDEIKKYLFEVENEQNLVYYSDIYFWDDESPKPEKLQVILDTGSSWLWAPSSICQGCPSDNTLSHVYMDNIGDGVKKVKYGSGGISGDIVRATVSLDRNRKNAVTNYKMLEVTSAEMPSITYSKWDGILGLLPSAISGSKLFVTEMYDAGILAENAFGIYYTDTRGDSQITFGGYDTSKVKNYDDFAFIDLYSGNHWSAALHDARYGTKNIGSAKSAILDSGTSMILLTHSMFDEFKAVVNVGRT